MDVLNQSRDTSVRLSGSKALRLQLTIRDPDVIAELVQYPEGGTREEFARSALRVGVLAIRQASGMLDARSIREEGERLVSAVRELLTSQTTSTLESISGTLKRYFDPTQGDLPQRLERLVRKDGELESVLCRHLSGDSSTIAQTMARHIGAESPLLRLLSPNQSEGVIASLTEVVRQSLEEQRDHLLGQFSLDDKDSALSRLVRDLSDANGHLKKELAEDLAEVRKEFSLDNEQGALSRLVTRVEAAHHTISEQFSRDNEQSAISCLSRMLEQTHSRVEASLTLDNEESPLYRIRRELLKVFEDLQKSNTAFQAEVRATLESVQARRAEAERSTRHGDVFEEAVGHLIREESRRLGDVCEATGNRTGHVRHCKVGDYTITLGPESAAPGARIVCEAKAHKSYSIAKALEEIAVARENRRAQVGLFVFSAPSAPEAMEPVARYGNDLLVRWDQDDPTTDLYLTAGVSIARALVSRERVLADQTQVEFAETERAIERIARAAKTLAEITTWAQTIKSNSEKILDKAERTHRDLGKQVELLSSQVKNLKRGIGAGGNREAEPPGQPS